jgi:hypothetical protein
MVGEGVIHDFQYIKGTETKVYINNQNFGSATSFTCNFLYAVAELPPHAVIVTPL